MVRLAYVLSSDSISFIELRDDILPRMVTEKVPMQGQESCYWADNLLLQIDRILEKKLEIYELFVLVYSKDDVSKKCVESVKFLASDADKTKALINAFKKATY